MEIRKASVQDLGQIMQVYDKARKFMRGVAHDAHPVPDPGIDHRRSGCARVGVAGRVPDVRQPDPRVRRAGSPEQDVSAAVTRSIAAAVTAGSSGSTTKSQKWCGRSSPR